MIEYVGFDLPSDGAGVEADPQRTVATRVPLTWPVVMQQPSVAVGGVAWMAGGECSLMVEVGAGHPAVAASVIRGELGLGVAVVTLSGSGTATIELNRPPASDVQVTWFVVQPS